MKLPEVSPVKSVCQRFKEEDVMVSVGSEVKLTNGKRAVKYVVVGLEKPLPMFEEGGQ